MTDCVTVPESVVNTLEAAARSFVAATESDRTSKCEPNETCRLRIEALEKDSDAMQRALYGHNGDSAGLIGIMKVVQQRLDAIEKANDRLNQILIGLAISVFMTMIGTFLNLFMK